MDFERFSQGALVGPDGGVGVDSDSADATADANSIGPYCESLNPHPTFCSDFDETPVLAGWQPPSTQSPGEGGVEPGIAKSLPNAFVAKARRCDGGSCSPGLASIRRNLGEAFKEWKLSFDVYLEITPDGTATGGPLVAALTYGDDYTIQLFLAPLDSNLLEKRYAPDGGTLFRSHKFDFKTVGVGQWRHVEVSLSPLDGGSDLSLKVDDDVVIADDPSLAHQFANVSPSLFVGIFSISQPCDDWTVRVDNVVFDGR